MIGKSLKGVVLTTAMLAFLVQGADCVPTVPDPSQKSLNIATTGQGSVNCSPATNKYPTGSEVTLTATPSAGWVFDCWQGALTGSGNPATLIMDADKSVTAVFVQSSSQSGCVELNVADIQSDTVIPAGCYLVNADIEVNNGTLTLAPGVTLKFAAGTRLNVHSAGGLHAVGTASQPIVLTSQSATRGYWYGIFYGSNSADNVMDYVTIEYGGKNSPDMTANLTLWYGAEVAVTNCTLRESGTYGLGFGNQASNAILSTFESNTFTRNKLGAAFVHACAVGFLNTSTNTYTGNDADAVVVGWGSTEVDQTWANIGVPYIITREMNIDKHTTFAPGVELVFEHNIPMYIKSDGKLTAVGTAAKPIVFTGAEKTPGFWKGLSFASYGRTQHLEYVTVEYAGAAGLNAAGLGLWDATIFTIMNCTIRNNGGYGIHLRQSTVNGATASANNRIAAQIVAVNTFANNASGNVFEAD